MTVNTDITFDTDKDCTATSKLGRCTAVTGAIVPNAAVAVCVCRAESFAVKGIKVTGARALAIFAMNTFAVSGTIDASGVHQVPGPGAISQYSAATSDYTFGQGVAGGSYATHGGNSSQPVWGQPALSPLAGGMTGQTTCGGTKGGGGGGAIQLVAGVMLDLTNAIIVAGGGGGQGSMDEDYCVGGAGGGSGGAVLVEAPTIVTSPATIIAANGGGGGAGASSIDGNGEAGDNGRPAIEYAEGGSGYDAKTSCNYTDHFGRGGAGSLHDSAGENGEPGLHRNPCWPETELIAIGSGGGGGGAGRIRINTVGSKIVEGMFTPTPTTGEVTIK